MEDTPNLDHTGREVTNPIRHYMDERWKSIPLADRSSCPYSDCLVMAEDKNGKMWYFISRRVGVSHIKAQLEGMSKGSKDDPQLTLFKILKPWPEDLADFDGLPELHS
jgi:hypothetical protein